MAEAIQSTKQSEHFDARLIAEVVIGSIGVALLLFALAANHRWLDRHFLPAFFVSRRVYVVVLSLVRIVAGTLGAALVFLMRPAIRLLAARVPGRTLLADAARLSLAVTLALGTSEFVLRLTFRHSSEEQAPTEEPLRHRDPRLGWTFVPARTGHDSVAGRMIEYSFDSSGYRVRRPSEPVDPERPTVVFTGESIMVGEGLTWDETVPAQVEAILGIQSANLAVHGFASDQAFMRLSADLPRFRRPVAVVSPFIPALFDRNMDEDRPHLGPDLTWIPANPRWRLAIIASWLVPYRSDEEIEHGVAMTRAVLRATVALARARGATPLIVVPQFIPEDPTERALRRRILDATALPCVWVGLDPNWRLPGNLHPDARAARVMAISIAARLLVR